MTFARAILRIAVIQSLFIAPCLHGESEKQDAFTKLPKIIKERIAHLHPQQFSESLDRSLAERAVNPGFYSANAVNAGYEIDFPNAPDWRAVFIIRVAEYRDEATAAGNYSLAKDSAAQRHDLFFENARGFDLLGTQGNAVMGLLNRHFFKAKMYLIPRPNDSGANLWTIGRPPTHAENGWYAGMADFLLDAWREAQGLPHKGMSIAFVEPGKTLRRSGPNFPFAEGQAFSALPTQAHPVDPLMQSFLKGLSPSLGILAFTSLVFAGGVILLRKRKSGQ